jgi:hypothetical protein
MKKFIARGTVLLSAMISLMGSGSAFAQLVDASKDAKSDAVATPATLPVPELGVKTGEPAAASPMVLSFPQTLQARPGRDRFLSNPAHSTDELVESLKTNRAFRTNLSKHFGIPEDRLIDFVQDALVPAYLPEDTSVMNYGVTKAGAIYGKRMKLKKGQAVWATRSGQPILKWECSNPLSKTPPPGTTLRSKPSVSNGVSSSELSVKSDAQMAMIDSEIGGADLSGSLALGGMPNVPSATVADTVKSGGGSVGTKIAAPIGVAAAAGAIRGIPLLPIAGLAGLVVRSVPQPDSSLDTNAVPKSNLSPNAAGDLSPNAVPEPGTLALLGLGALPLLRLVRRRK